MKSFSEKMRILQGMVFDFDGTLAHLTIDFDEMRREAASLAEDYLNFRPGPDKAPVLEWIEQIGLTISGEKGAGREKALEFREKCLEMIQEIELRAAEKGELFDYTRPLLARLSENGVSTAIITRNCSRAVRIVFPDIGDYCPCLLARDQTKRVKPDPAHLREALKSMGVCASRAMMVGDHPMDIQTGRRAGTMTGGVASGREPLESLLQLGPDAAAADLPELVRFLAGAGFLPPPLADRRSGPDNGSASAARPRL